jgi:hypothetical protein
MDRIDGKVPQATILQGCEEQPGRYVEVPRKAANADEWLKMQTPALANDQPGGDKLNSLRWATSSMAPLQDKEGAEH